MTIATSILAIVSIYAAVGILVGTAFVLVGVSRVDQSATGSGAPWHFRLAILPGSAMLWPLVLRWWVGASRSSRTPLP